MPIGGIGPVKLGVLLMVGLGVTVGGAFAIGLVGTPDVVGIDNSFGDVSTDMTVIETDLHLHNPNPVGVTLGGLTVDYEIQMNEVSMAHGVREGVSVPRGDSTAELHTEMNNSNLPDWWVSHLQNGEETALTIHADVHHSLLNRSFDAPAVERQIDTDLIKAFNSEEDREVDADLTGVQDPVLIVRETSGEWGTVSEDTTEIRMEFLMYNPREFPVTLTDIGYDVEMNDVTMGEGETDESYVIPPDEEETVTATFRLDNGNLDDWWVTHLENDQVTQLTADFYLRIDLSEVGAGTTTVPLDTMEQTIETDMFGERDGESDREGNDDTGSSGSDTADSDDETADSDDETADSDDETADSEETETPTPTPDSDFDDGGEDDSSDEEEDDESGDGEEDDEEEDDDDGLLTVGEERFR